LNRFLKSPTVYFHKYEVFDMRNVLGIVAGLATGLILVFAFEMIGHVIFPVPGDFDASNPEEIARRMSELSLGSLLSVVVAWFAGTLGAAFVATKVGQDTTMMSASVIGSILALLGVVNFFMIPHPAWMVVAGLIAFATGAYLGGTLALGKISEE
jgi:hypothetical protein